MDHSISERATPRQKQLGLPAETYLRLQRLAKDDRRTMVAVVERLLAAAEVLR